MYVSVILVGWKFSSLILYGLTTKVQNVSKFVFIALAACYEANGDILCLISFSLKDLSKDSRRYFIAWFTTIAEIYGD
jgi:hypothetical protein